MIPPAPHLCPTSALSTSALHSALRSSLWFASSQPLPCVLLASLLSPAFWIISVAGLIFPLHSLVTRLFNFCLNFVCLSFSLLACSLSVHAVVLTVFAAHSLLPLAFIRCKLRTCGECLLPLAPSPCEYKAGQFLHFVSHPHLLLRIR